MTRDHGASGASTLPFCFEVGHTHAPFPSSVPVYRDGACGGGFGLTPRCASCEPLGCGALTVTSTGAGGLT
eukprot:889474-Rhodomonas_salina.2